MGGGRELFGCAKTAMNCRLRDRSKSVMTPTGPQTLASIVDITWRKINEAKLRQNENQLRVIIDSIKDLRFSCSIDGRVMEAGIVALK